MYVEVYTSERQNVTFLLSNMNEITNYKYPEVSPCSKSVDTFFRARFAYENNWSHAFAIELESKSSADLTSSRSLPSSQSLSFSSRRFFVSCRNWSMQGKNTKLCGYQNINHKYSFLSFQISGSMKESLGIFSITTCKGLARTNGSHS